MVITMKKTNVLSALFIASAIVFASCEKEIETSNLTLDKSQKATVKAYLYAELDNTKQGLEFAPNGTKVIVSIPNSSFNGNATGKWMDTVSVTNGLIETTVPTTNAGVTVTFTPAEFTSDQVQPFGSLSNTISKLYKVTTSNTLSVFPNETRTSEITYNSFDSFDNFAEKVNVKIELKAIFKEGDASVVLPQNTTISVFNNGWATTATVGEKGLITVSVPKGETITLRFEATKTLLTIPVTTKKYRYEAKFDAPSTSTPVQYSEDFGDGEVWE